MHQGTEELEGWEFDWFAADEAGNFALFSTAGSGPVPNSIKPFTERYQDISASIDTPSWGSKDIWRDYAAVGLFVFDWKLHGGPYEKVESPGTTPSTELRSRLSLLPGFPVYPFEFSAVHILGLAELQLGA